LEHAFISYRWITASTHWHIILVRYLIFSARRHIGLF